VENVNMVKKHQKPNPNAGVAGGIVEKEMPIHVSNVMLFNPKPARLTASVSGRWKTAARFVLQVHNEVVDA
jgi:large subunit ribosomal protein L24